MEVIRKFFVMTQAFIKSKIAEELAIPTNNKAEKRLFKKNNKFLRYQYKLPHYYEMLEYDEINSKFSQEEIDYITIYLINKIRGIYKHAQSNKTWLCNIAIITSIKLNRFMICITKNTIEANSQWTKRLIIELKKEFPNTPLKDLILVCSSKHNTLDDNATHCKDVSSVFTKIGSSNTFRVLFICSNNTRIKDIITLLNAYSGLNVEKQLPIDIQWDEAHNSKEGIPSKRPLIENILLYPIVETLTPCTATPEPLYDETNPLWQENNLEKNAINYTHMSKIKSTSPNYLSLSKAISVNFEDIKTHPSYSEKGITEFKLEYFIKVDSCNYIKFKKDLEIEYINEGDDEETIYAKIEEAVRDDIDRRRQLGYHPFMKGEEDHFNIGMNVLDNFYELSGTTTKIYIHNETNFHIISTPKRNAFTYSLANYAIEQSYKPIVIALYKGKIYILYKDISNNTIEIEYGDFSEKDSAKQFNEKIEHCLKYLIKNRVNIKVPIIFMGNYIPTGESITFANKNYGLIRSCALFPGIDSTPATDNQALSRICLVDTQFKEIDPSFIAPERIICSYKQNIDNALIVEISNDCRIDEFIENQLENSGVFVPELNYHLCDDSEIGDENISIPAKIQIDDIEDKYITKLFKILEKPQRSTEDKTKILKLLRKSNEKKIISFIDQTGKFDFNQFTLKDVRTYRKKEKSGDEKEDSWRFPQYHSHHNQKLPYINAKNSINRNECELYACNDRYINDDGFVNPKQRMWLSYRY